MATRSAGDAGARRAPLMAQHRGVVAAFPRLTRTRVLLENAKQFLPDDMLVIRCGTARVYPRCLGVSLVLWCILGGGCGCI